MDERELHLDRVHRDDIVMRFACPQLPHETLHISQTALPIASRGKASTMSLTYRQLSLWNWGEYYQLKSFLFKLIIVE
jgi:hypothetical protein